MFKCLFSCKFISKSRKLLLTEITQKNFTRITFDLFVIFIKKLLQTGEKMKNKSNKEKWLLMFVDVSQRER